MIGPNMDAPAQKQKKAHLPVADAGSAAPKASVSGWASLTPELVGTLSKYLDLPSSLKKRDGGGASTPDTPNAAGDSNKLGELMNLCLVAGPNTATSIRRAYLRNNETFLLYSMLLPLGEEVEEEGMDDEAFTKLATKQTQNIRQWMEVNQDWKDHCSDPEKFRQYQEEACPRGKLPRKHAKDLFEFELISGRFLRVKSIGDTSPIRNEKSKRRVKTLGGHYLLRLGNCFVKSGDSFENILDALEVDNDATEATEGDDDKNGLFFQFLKHPYAMFGNPVIAAELGLTEVVRFLIEEKGLDVNGTWNGIHVWKHTLSITSLILSQNAAVSKYILTNSNVDLGMKFDEYHGNPNFNGGTLLHLFVRYHCFDADLMKMLLSHKTVDVNARLPADNATALFITCSAPVLQSDHVEKVRMLLENGADPLLRSNQESGSLAPLERIFFISVDDRNDAWSETFLLLAQASGAENNEDLVELHPFLSELVG